jgi:hypothetical protein
MIAGLSVSGVPPWFMLAHSAGETPEAVDNERRPCQTGRVRRTCTRPRPSSRRSAQASSGEAGRCRSQWSYASSPRSACRCSRSRCSSSGAARKRHRWRSWIRLRASIRPLSLCSGACGPAATDSPRVRHGASWFSRSRPREPRRKAPRPGRAAARNAALRGWSRVRREAVRAARPVAQLPRADRALHVGDRDDADRPSGARRGGPSLPGGVLRARSRGAGGGRRPRGSVSDDPSGLPAVRLWCSKGGQTRARSLRRASRLPRVGGQRAVGARFSAVGERLIDLDFALAARGWRTLAPSTRPTS